MVLRVATFALSDQMIAAALRAQSTMANEQLQQASGIVSPDYGGLGETSRQVINLQISVSRSQSYIDAASSADNKVQVAYSTVTSIANLVSDFRSTLAGASNGVSSNSNLEQSARQNLQEMESLLNTQYSGIYLFGGSKITSPPVDVSAASYPAMTSPSTASNSYYKGDDQVASVRVADDQVVSYGVTADNPAFEQALRAMNLVANNSPVSTATLQEAMNLAAGAVSAISNVEAGISQASAAIESASSNQSDYQNFAKTLGSNLTSVDVAAVTAQLSTYQAQLTAAYSAISKIQGLSLASYLH